MRRFLISLILACAASGFAYAQEPAAKPDPNSPHPPENRMDEATPTMKAPEGAKELAPTNRVGEAVPPMKATDSQTSTEKSAATTAQPSGSSDLTVSEEAAKEWIGRTVYSSEGTKLGAIAALQRDPDGKVTELRADMGGFLGFGESRVRITSDQIKEATDDGVTLTLTEAEAKTLPTIETE